VRLSVVLPDFQPDQKIDGLAISPLTTMAEALGDARLARGDKEADYRAARERSLSLIGGHFGDVDLLLVTPVDVTADASTTSTCFWSRSPT